jgi:hypothetical protein
MSEHLPINKTLHLQDATHNPLCPECKQEDENHYHFPSCEHQTRKQHWENLAIELGSFGTKTKNDPNLQNALIRGTTEYWKEDQQPEPPPTPQLQQLFSHQQKLGWKQLLYGRFSKKWAAEYERLHMHNHHQPSPISGKQWVSQAIRIIWRHVLEIWKTRCEDEHGKHQKPNIPQTAPDY